MAGVAKPLRCLRAVESTATCHPEAVRIFPEAEEYFWGDYT